MCARARALVCLCVCACVCVCVHARVSVCSCVRMCMCVYARLCVLTPAFVFAWVCCSCVQDAVLEQPLLAWSTVNFAAGTQSMAPDIASAAGKVCRLILHHQEVVRGPG